MHNGKFSVSDLPREMRDTARLAVNYDLSFDQMVDHGCYDSKSSHITVKNFPVSGSGIVLVERKLFHFDCIVTSDEAERLILAEGYQPGKIEHLLASGAANPDEQRRFPIIALGSVAGVYGERHVACLGRIGSKRDIYLRWRVGDWGGIFRFLGVRNIAL